MHYYHMKLLSGWVAFYTDFIFYYLGLELTSLLLFRVNFFCSCMFSLKNRPKHFIRSLYHYLFHAYFQYNGLK